MVGYWENGKVQEIGHSKHIPLATAFNISLEELYGEQVTEVELEDNQKARLFEILSNIQARHKDGDPLYLPHEDLSFLIEHTPLKSLMPV